MLHEYHELTPHEIAVGAYHVWEKESRPSGRQKENWIEAETLLRLNPSIRKSIVSVRNENDAVVQTALTMPKSGKRMKARLPRVLVVDDEPPATHMLGGLLKRHGYIVAELNDPAKAVQTARRFKPDIVLLDMHMPWKDGHEVKADFALDNSLSCVPIIFITHHALDRENSTESNQILVKPFSIEDLLASLEEGITRPI